LSDEAQRDTSSFHRLIQSVKITATKDELLFESGASQLATKWAIDLAEESGIEVKEEGIVLVPAKELFGWASKQFKSKIALTLVKLKVPEIIKTGDADTDYGSGQSISVKKIGTLKIVSRDESKTGNKWNLDCYDPEQMNSVDFEDAPKTLINIPSVQLTDALKNVAFSSQPKDYQHIFDSIVLERYKGNVYMAASDCHRCSTYCLDKASDVDKKFFTETVSTDGNVSYGQKILIPATFLKGISKIARGDTLSVAYDEDKNKVFLSIGDWSVRISAVDSKEFNKFPTVAMLMGKKYTALGSIPKEILTNRLVSASMVNEHMVLFYFKKSKDSTDTVVIHAISEDGHAPNVSNAPVNDLVKDVKAIWGVKHIMEVAKVIKDDNITFLIPDDLKSVKVISSKDKNLEYYSMVIDNPKYSHLI